MPMITRRSVAIGGTLLLVAALAGCGQSAGSWTSDVDPTVLDTWQDFPVTRSPRPILLLGDPLRQAGYKTGDEKVAVLEGRYELATALPSTALATVTVTLPDGVFSMPVITAAQAYDAVRGSAYQEGPPDKSPDVGSPSGPYDNPWAVVETPTSPTPRPLRITKVELGTAPFQTDRGRLQLPAWLFDAPELLEPLAWPALHQDAFWRFGELPYPAGEAQLAADGVTLTVTMVAPDPFVCPGEPIYRYHPVVVESPTSVAVGLRRETVSVATAPGSSDCSSDRVVWGRRLLTQPYQVTLATRLSSRVLINGSGRVWSVTVDR